MNKINMINRINKNGYFQAARSVWRRHGVNEH